jgi:adenylate cyclase
VKHLTVVRVSLGIALLTALLRLAAPTPLELLDMKALDFRHVVRGPLDDGGDVVIAAIDEKSLAELGRWPWPRARLATLVDALTVAGASVVGFDVIFDAPDASVPIDAIRSAAEAAPARSARELADDLVGRDNDAVLATAFRSSRRVILGEFFEFAGAPDPALALAHFPELSARTAKDANVTVLREATRFHGSIAPLVAAAAGAGHINFFPDGDGAYRRVPLAVRVGDRVAPAMSLEVLRRARGGSPPLLTLANYGVSALRAGGHDLPVDEAGELWIDYLGPPHTFHYVSASDVVAGRVAPETFAGKIVLVGFAAAGFDEVSTPFAAVVPGVEVQATVVDNIIHDRALRRPRWLVPVEAGAILALGLVLGLLLRRLAPAMGAATAAVVAAAWLLVTQRMFSTSGLVLSAVYPLGGILFSTLGIAVFRAVTEEREKRKVRTAFRHYLNPEVTELLAREPERLKLGGERRAITILFSDIRGFTTISEGLDPESLGELLNEYLGAMTDILFLHEGLLDKYIGDAVMAFWGAPIGVPDHAARCCRAALDMLDALPALHARWQARGWPVIEIGIGIDTGDAVVGNFGSATRFNYTAMGDHVNLASRLEGLNKMYGTHLLISESTREAVGDDFVCREVDRVRVKGKNVPVGVFEVLGRREDDDGRRRALAEGFATALAAYRRQAWDEAIAALERLATAHPDDGPIGLYVERCRALRAAPPGADWDGVFVAKTK